MKKIIIDCDPGIDDSVAMFYLFRQKNIKVLAITTGFGNASAVQGAENALRILDLAGVSYEVPVAVGAEISLSGKTPPTVPHVHGDNGVGNVSLPTSNRNIAKVGAVDLIIDLVHRHPGEITLLTLGRFTNLAQALEREPMLPRLVKNVVSMGGTVYAPGNVTPYAEANIRGDAEAANVVFQAGFDITVVGLDVTLKTWLRMADIDSLSKGVLDERDQATVRYLKEALTYYMGYYKSLGCEEHTCPVHDPSAVLYMLYPELYKTACFPATVECMDDTYYGQIRVDETAPNAENCVRFALQVDNQLAVSELLSGILRH